MKIQDTVMSATFWREDRFRLPPHLTVLYLRMLSATDRDGIARVSRRHLHHALGSPCALEKSTPGTAVDAYIYSQMELLQDRGLILRYGDKKAEYVWVVDSVGMQPSHGALKRSRCPEYPAPSPEGVVAVLSQAWGRRVSEEEARKVMPRAWGLRSSAAVAVPDDAVKAVFTAWSAGFEHPDRLTLTSAAAKQIRAALKDWEVTDLQVLMRYAHEADESRAQFWRGEAPTSQEGQTYMGLDNLLAPSKLQGKVLLAQEWAGKMDDERDSPGGEEVDLGPMARFRDEDAQEQAQRREEEAPRAPAKAKPAPRNRGRQMSLGGLQL